MIKGQLLTLSITETKKNNYQIIGYLLNSFKFVVVNTCKYKNNNKFLLDIGAISNIYYEEKSENEIKLIGDIVIDKYLSKNELCKFLDKELDDFSSFKRRRFENFGVIKLSNIEEICITKNIKLDSFLVLISNGIKEKVKIKDFRWISYWNYIYDSSNKEKINDRKEYYRNFFNSKDTYVILFRLKDGFNNLNNTRFISNKDIYWISGIFYI